VVGASARALLGQYVNNRRMMNSQGFRRTTPNREKSPRPSIVPGFSSGTYSHGVGSSCSAMTNSMLASPQGASELYMWMRTPSLNENGSTEPVVRSSAVLRWMNGEERELVASCCSSSRRYLLKARSARTSAWQSWTTLPPA
jgi:hypothetical protein